MMDPLEHLQMLRDRAAGLGPGKSDFRRIRALQFTEPGFDRVTWRAMCDKGWLDPQRSLGASGIGALAERMGADLMPEPMIPAAMAARLLPDAQRAAVTAGERVVLPAWQESADSLDFVGQTILQDGRLVGRKLLVPMAAGADAFLVTIPGGLALVERHAPGVSLELRQTQDGGNSGTLTFDGAPAEGIEDDASEALESAITATAAYLLGLTGRAFDITCSVLNARETFSRSLGNLDTLQRRVTDMEVQIALTRAAIEAAEKALDTAQPIAETRAAVSRARLRASDAAMVVTRDCVQLHGAVHAKADDIDLFARKAMVVASLYGSSVAHRARVRQKTQETSDE